MALESAGTVFSVRKKWHVGYPCDKLGNIKIFYGLWMYESQYNPKTQFTKIVSQKCHVVNQYD